MPALKEEIAKLEEKVSELQNELLYWENQKNSMSLERELQRETVSQLQKKNENQKLKIEYLEELMQSKREKTLGIAYNFSYTSQKK